MVSTRPFALAAFVACASSRALPQDARLLAPGFLKLPLQAAQVPPSMSFDLQKAGGPEQVFSQFKGFKYTVNLAIGNNYQPVVLQVDTGSSETWVNPECSTADSPDAALMDFGLSAVAQCRSAPKYNPNKSASARNLTTPFCAEYDGGKATGTYFVDDMRISERMLKKQRFGVGKESHGLSTGVLGLGPSAPQQVWNAPMKVGTQSSSNEPVSSGFLDNLKAQGLIKRAAFSLSLRTVGKNGGLVLGGIDTKKYNGQLAKFAMKSHSYQIPMSAVGQTFPNGSSIVYKRPIWNHGINPSVPALLSSGTPFVVLPQDLALAIGAGFPKAALDEAKSRFIVPCDSLFGTLDFSFGEHGPSKQIRVPYADFVYRSEEEKDSNGEALCVLGMMFARDNNVVLGNSFLRAAYVVFDAEGREILIGEADDCGEDVVVISGEDGVPEVSGCS